MFSTEVMPITREPRRSLKPARFLLPLLFLSTGACRPSTIKTDCLDPYLQPYAGTIRQEAARQGVSERLAFGVAMTEGFRGIKGAAGEHGIFQLMPATGQEMCQELGIFPCDLSYPPTNIRAGLKYLANMQKLWRDENSTVRAYNGGPNGPNNPLTEVYKQRFDTHVANIEACSRARNEAQTSTSSKPGSVYTIQPGDSLSGIAQKHNTTVQELQRINDISNPDVIIAGTPIRVR